MFIASIILYFGDTPAGYDLHKSANGFVLHRGPSNDTDSRYPSLVTIHWEEGWRVNEVSEADVVDQVLRLVETHQWIEFPQELSAAS